MKNQKHMKQIKYLPINWSNGLKLSGQHFIDAHLHMVECFQHLRAEHVTEYNYGIGMPLEHHSSSVSVEVVGAGAESSTIRLNHCNAITLGGSTIVFEPELYGSFSPELTLSDLGKDAADGGVYIAVTASYNRLIPVGYPDPNEIPLRHPHLLLEIRITAVPVQSGNEHFLNKDFVIIGKGLLEGRGFVLDDEYIPPVQRLAYSQKLRTSLNGTIVHLNHMEDCIGQIYQKNVDDSRRSTLTSNVFTLCRAIDEYYAHQFFQIENILIEEPPIRYLQSINILARSIFNALRTISNKEYEYMLQYFYEWTEISPSSFETTVGDVLSLKYNHLDIAKTNRVVQKFVTTLDTIVKKMSELDYIGLIRENIIISDDSNVEQEKTQKTWRFID